MIRSLNISTYADGYNPRHIECEHIPIAAASGHFDYNYYYYYCFYYSLLSNWTKMSIENLTNISRLVLKKFGLGIELKYFNTFDGFIKSVYKSIDNGSPVLIQTKYSCLFYSPNYKTSKNQHSFLLSGYNFEKKTVIIQDIEHAWDLYPESSKSSVANRNSNIRGTGLYRLQVTEDMLFDIFQDTLQTENHHPGVCITTIQAESSSLVKGFNDLFVDIIDNFDLTFSKFANWLKNEYIQAPKSNELFTYLRRIYLGPLTIFFEVIEKAFTKQSLEQVNYFDIKLNYLENREFVFSKLHAECLRGNTISEQILSEFVGKIQFMDNSIISCIKQLVKNNKLHGSDKYA